MRNQEWDSALAKLDALDLAELVLGLLGLDAVDGEAALGIVDEAEVLAGLLNGDDVHEAGGVGQVSADLAVDLDETLHEDRLGLAVVKGVLETVADEDDQGHAVAELVRTGRGLGGVDTGQFVQEPVGGGAKALLVLLAAFRDTLASWSFASVFLRLPKSCRAEGKKKDAQDIIRIEVFQFYSFRQDRVDAGVHTYIPRAIVSVG